MKNVNIKVERPTLLPDGFVHTGTTYLIGKKIDFTNEAELLVNNKNDTVNLTEKKFPLDIVKGEPIYLVTRYEYTDTKEISRTYDRIDSTTVSDEDKAAYALAMSESRYSDAIIIINKYKEYTLTDNHSSYSRITPLLGDQEDIVISDVMVNTPKLTLSMDYIGSDEGTVVVNSTEFEIYTGAGTHKCTTWITKSINGRVLDTREKDGSNLTSYPLPDHIKKTDNFITTAYYHSDTGAVSYGGQVINTNTSGYNGLFNVEQVGRLVITRPQYFKVSLNTFNFDSLELVVRNDSGKLLKEIIGIKHLGPKVLTDDLIFGKEYTFEFRLKLSNGVVTEPIVLKDKANSDPVLYDESKTYTDRYDYKHLLMLNGKTSHLSYQLYNKSILLMLNGSKAISLFKYIDDTLINVGEIIDLPVTTSVYNPDVFVNQLRNGDVIIAYASRDAIDNGSVIINTYEFNPISNKLTLKDKHKSLGVNGLAISGSITTTWSNYVYYVEEGTADRNPNLVKYNPYDQQSTKIEMDIPAKNNIAIVRDLDDNVIILGGTLTEKSNKPKEFITRSNNKVYKLDSTLNTISEVGVDLLKDLTNDVYSFHAIVRHTGDITLFNNLDNGNTPIVGDQSTSVLSIKNERLDILTNDHDDVLPYLGSVVLLNGDVLRFTSLTRDPQKLYSYITNTMSVDDMDDNDSISVDPNVLIAKPGEVLTTDEIARYDVVRSDEDGIINYVTTAGTMVIDKHTLVVTRDLVMERSIYNALGYGKYIVADGVQFLLKE